MPIILASLYQKPSINIFYILFWIYFKGNFLQIIILIIFQSFINQKNEHNSFFVVAVENWIGNFSLLPRHILMVNHNNNRTCTMSFRICLSKFSFLQANLWTHEKDNLLFVYFQINTNLTDRQKGIGEYWWLTWNCFVTNDRSMDGILFCLLLFCEAHHNYLILSLLTYSNTSSITQCFFFHFIKSSGIYWMMMIH